VLRSRHLKAPTVKAASVSSQNQSKATRTPDNQNRTDLLNAQIETQKWLRMWTQLNALSRRKEPYTLGSEFGDMLIREAENTARLEYVKARNRQTELEHKTLTK